CRDCPAGDDAKPQGSVLWPAEQAPPEGAQLDRLNDPSTVDDEVDAGDEGCPLRQQEVDCVGYVVRGSQPAQRGALLHVGPALGGLGVDRLDHGREDGAGADRVAADAFWPELLGEGPAERDDSGLAYLI